MRLRRATAVAVLGLAATAGAYLLLQHSGAEDYQHEALVDRWLVRCMPSLPCPRRTTQLLRASYMSTFRWCGLQLTAVRHAAEGVGAAPLRPRAPFIAWDGVLVSPSSPWGY
jgi:hypothetical protein